MTELMTIKFEQEFENIDQLYQFVIKNTDFIENIGELIVLAGAFKADILVFIVDKINPTISEPITWLKNAFKGDMDFISVKSGIKKSQTCYKVI